MQRLVSNVLVMSAIRRVGPRCHLKTSSGCQAFLLCIEVSVAANTVWLERHDAPQKAAVCRFEGKRSFRCTFFGLRGFDLRR